MDFLKGIENSHKESFDKYFEGIVKEEVKNKKHLESVYQEYYEGEQLNQEEDKEYIEGMRRKLKEKAE